MLKKKLETFPKVNLANLPTPLEELKQLSEFLGGPRIFVKRDDCTGLAMGGNKTRKFEFVLGEALSQGVDTIITEGPIQSNSVRQAAAACNKLGLDCHLVLSTQCVWHQPGYEYTGNRLLLELLGSKMHFADTEFDRPALMEKVAASLTAAGKSPFIVPTGASNATGSLGYTYCAQEIMDQAKERGFTPDRIIVASGSGGTQGGLVAGLVAMKEAVDVIGIDIDALPDEVHNWSLECARGAGELLGIEVAEELIKVKAGYAGSAYALPTTEMIEAIKLVARIEGLILDPVYSGKAMFALIDMIKSGEIAKEEMVVFIHTGGTPNLYAYSSVLFETS